jgi:hypothetical protein
VGPLLKLAQRLVNAAQQSPSKRDDWRVLSDYWHTKAGHWSWKVQFGQQWSATKGAQLVVKYLLAMELNINAYAIMEAGNEEEAKKKGADLKFDCDLSPVDNYGKIVSVVPFYYGDVDAEVVDAELYEYAPNIQSLLQEERFQRALRERDKKN